MLVGAVCRSWRLSVPGEWGVTLGARDLTPDLADVDGMAEGESAEVGDESAGIVRRTLTDDDVARLTVR